MLTVRKFRIIVAAVAVAILLCVVVSLSCDFGWDWCGGWKFRIIVAAVAGLLCVVVVMLLHAVVEIPHNCCGRCQSVVLSCNFASSDGNSAYYCVHWV